jgi:pyridoxal 5'-phosphate synthase pdxS subunit
MFKQKSAPGYDLQKGSFEVKVRHSNLLKGGVIMEVSTPQQAKIAEDAGAIAVTVAASSKEQGTGPASARLIQQVQEQVSIPVIAKCRAGHIVEGQILEALFVDFIEESESLSPMDLGCSIDKHAFRIPFICGASSLAEALRKVAEGASSIRAIGEGNRFEMAETAASLRLIRKQIQTLSSLDSSELRQAALSMGAPYDLVCEVAKKGKLSVPLFAAGGVLHPADAALMMRLGAESVCTDLAVFTFADPLAQAKAIVGGVTYYNDAEMLAKVVLGYFNDIEGTEMRVLAKEEEFLKREQT